MDQERTSRRVLVTGLSTYWGGRLAQALEQDPAVETVIGIDRRPPKVPLERTEFVQVSDSHSLIRRIVDAAEIDTVVDTRLVVDSIVTTPRRAHENNVIGTMNVLAACGGADSPVRKVVFKSSAHYYGAEQDDPAFFTEEMRRPHPPRTPIERDVVEAEANLREFAEKHPDTIVTTLRFANGLGPDVNTSHTRYLGLPAIPTILGFDPRYQFIHEDDIAGCLQHAVHHDLPGVFNCAADGVLALSEVIGLLGKANLPVLPPLGTGIVAAQLRRAGVRVSSEMLGLLRFGRGLDNRRFKATGYRYRYTTRETVLKLREHQRLHPLMRQGTGPYRYEAAVEEFLRFSPSVRKDNVSPGLGRVSPRQLAELRRAIDLLEGEGAPQNTAPGDRRPSGELGTGRRNGAPAGYDDLDAEEVIALLPSLDPADLPALRAHEESHAGRESVVRAIDGLLAVQGATSR
ncbi:NAD-dependent epimerase/dehydratase family protein [Conexibacter sp. SYSU D00693]|uniref:NAD-dependent epimerase/dehydratase family protein n=1 Tax=Conexibacter sp. SYSU D00693 TaxID=2812560 RepID=UPI00196AF3F2|nr:NAD-dependent epimerase/dehydratase family protein [Conexibacter sp. SYSU D00693]